MSRSELQNPYRSGPAGRRPRPGLAAVVAGAGAVVAVSAAPGVAHADAGDDGGDLAFDGDAIVFTEEVGTGPAHAGAVGGDVFTVDAVTGPAASEVVDVDIAQQVGADRVVAGSVEGAGHVHVGPVGPGAEGGGSDVVEGDGAGGDGVSGAEPVPGVGTGTGAAGAVPAAAAAGGDLAFTGDTVALSGEVEEGLSEAGAVGGEVFTPDAVAVAGTAATAGEEVVREDGPAGGGAAVGSGPVLDTAVGAAASAVEDVLVAPGAAGDAVVDGPVPSTSPPGTAPQPATTPPEAGAPPADDGAVPIEVTAPSAGLDLPDAAPDPGTEDLWPLVGTGEERTIVLRPDTRMNMIAPTPAQAALLEHLADPVGAAALDELRSSEYVITTAEDWYRAVVATAEKLRSVALGSRGLTEQRREELFPVPDEAELAGLSPAAQSRLREYGEANAEAQRRLAGGGASGFAAPEMSCWLVQCADGVARVLPQIAVGNERGVDVTQGPSRRDLENVVRGDGIHLHPLRHGETAGLSPGDVAAPSKVAAWLGERGAVEALPELGVVSIDLLTGTVVRCGSDCARVQVLSGSGPATDRVHLGGEVLPTRSPRFETPLPLEIAREGASDQVFRDAWAIITTPTEELAAVLDPFDVGPLREDEVPLVITGLMARSDQVIREFERAMSGAGPAPSSTTPGPGATAAPDGVAADPPASPPGSGVPADGTPVPGGDGIGHVHRGQLPGPDDPAVRDLIPGRTSFPGATVPAPEDPTDGSVVRGPEFDPNDVHRTTDRPPAATGPDVETFPADRPAGPGLLVFPDASDPDAPARAAAPVPEAAPDAVVGGAGAARPRPSPALAGPQAPLPPVDDGYRSSIRAWGDPRTQSAPAITSAVTTPSSVELQVHAGTPTTPTGSVPDRATARGWGVPSGWGFTIDASSAGSAGTVTGTLTPTTTTGAGGGAAPATDLAAVTLDQPLDARTAVIGSGFDPARGNVYVEVEDPTTLPPDTTATSTSSTAGGTAGAGTVGPGPVEQAGRWLQRTITDPLTRTAGQVLQTTRDLLAHPLMLTVTAIGGTAGFLPDGYRVELPDSAGTYDADGRLIDVVRGNPPTRLDPVLLHLRTAAGGGGSGLFHAPGLPGPALPLPTTPPGMQEAF